VIIPFISWHGTWFGRPLNDDELTQYLTDPNKSRRIQHGLAQIAERIEQGDVTVTQWYQNVGQLSEHPVVQVRVTSAWVMGQDPTSELFHEALLHMLQDDELLVRRNAALSLVRFGDAAGLNELRAMLLPHTVTAPVGGLVHYLVSQGDWVDPGTTLVRLITDNENREVDAVLSAGVQARLVPDGAVVEEGKALLTLSPDPEHVWESLRAISLVGGADELKLVSSLAQEPGFNSEVRKQAILTREAIQNRLSNDQRDGVRDGQP
ncbi:HEAT repeat domain-containing protein, partial [Acidobacteria bacterium AH-259-D05]|nr:HEAT repeat domain-containing protein [Acidobacteria bacterium AH-259-D05]